MASLVVLRPGPTFADAATSGVWMSVDGNVLVLKLAHDEGGRVDGGLLTINPGTRSLSWRGIEGETGCKEAFDAPFDQVRSVRFNKGVGFSLGIRDRKTMTFVPVVDAEWFRLQYHVSTGTAFLNQAIKDGQVVLAQGPRGAGVVNPMGTNGDSSFGGDKLIHAEIPDEVTADIRLAVDTILETLGRTPAPGLRVREALYGSPEDVDVSEVSKAPASFEGLAVRVRGKVEGSAPRFRLTADDASVAVIPSPEVEAAFRGGLAAGNVHDVELTGVFRQLPPTMVPGEAASDALGTVTFWDFTWVNEPRSGPDAVTLDRLASESKTFEGKTVRIVGKFRGSNLFADLPTTSWKNLADFVVKEDATAIWVTGIRPEGKGWQLDEHAPGDTQKWVEIVGRPSIQRGIIYLRASQISITTPPSGHAGVAEVRRFTGAGTEPPEVVFALPLLGEPVARKGLFVLQFSKSLDPATLKDRVHLRYVDGDHEFSHLSVSYDQDRRALVVDPGELLEAGREIEVFLSRGIVDADGIAFAGTGQDEAIYAIRYKVVRGASSPDGS